MDNRHLKNILIAFFTSSFLFIIFICAILLFTFPEKIFTVNILEHIHANSTGILGYSLMVCVLSSCALYFLQIKSKFIRFLLSIELLLYLLLLIIIDSIRGWVILIFASLIGSYCKYLLKEKKKNILAIPKLYLVIIVISIILIFTNSRSFLGGFQYNQISDKISLFGLQSNIISFKESLKIASSSFKNNWLLGSGQATFLYNFSKYTKGILSKDTATINNSAIQIAPFNDKIKWLRFNHSYNYFLDAISNLGLLGLCSYIGFIVVLFAVVKYMLRFSENQAKKQDIYFTFAPLLSLILLQLFVINNITILFFLWLSLALIAASLKNVFPNSFSDLRYIKEDGSGTGCKLFFLFEISSALFIIGISIVSIKTWKYRLAERNYKKYLIQETNANEHILKAIDLNPHSVDYLNSLSNICLNNIEKESSRNEQDLGILKEESVRGIEAVKRNTLAHPYFVSAWEKQGDLYMTVLPFVKKGASNWAIKSFERAMELEPNNTRFLLELGKAYLKEGTEGGVDSAKVDKAIEYFNQVVASCENDDLFGFDNSDKLCLDNEKVRIYLSKALEAKGEPKKAISELEKMQNENVMDTIDEDVMFELGRLYFNDGKLDKAADILGSIVNKNPNYSNALYTLGAVYEKMGKKNEAMDLYRRIAELNPGNEEVMEKIRKVDNSSELNPSATN